MTGALGHDRCNPLGHPVRLELGRLGREHTDITGLAGQAGTELMHQRLGVRLTGFLARRHHGRDEPGHDLEVAGEQRPHGLP